MTEGTIDYSSRDGVATITINRPAKRNAFSKPLCAQLVQAWQRLRDSPDDRVGVLTAAGPVFTAGADLNDPPPEFWAACPDLGVDIGKPVIATIQGPVVGMGVVLVAFCDLCVASSEARFVYPEARVGIAAGLISALTARIPHKVAMELMLLGEPISAARAYEVGLVNRVVPPAELLPAATAMAERLASSAPLVLKLLKQMARETVSHSPIEAMCLAQRAAQQVALSEDAQEGLLAFRQSRPPRFTGR